MAAIAIPAAVVAGRDIYPDVESTYNAKLPLPEDIRQYLKDTLWPNADQELADYDKFFVYFQQCIMDSIDVGLERFEDKFIVRTFQDFATVVTSLRNSLNSSKVASALALQMAFSMNPTGIADQRCLRTLELTARIWLTLDIHILGCPRGSFSFAWRDTESLVQLRSERLKPYAVPQGSADQPIERLIFDHNFNVVNLRNICGVDIAWTNNLAHHLSYDQRKDRLYVYPHKVCLASHLETSNVFEDQTLKDGIKSLDLLFPLGHRPTGRFLNEEKQGPLYSASFSFDSDNILRLDLSGFRYWRKELTILHEVFKRQPTKAYQLWHDKRNPLQWATFWLAAIIAILTIVFGIISSYTAFKQVSLAQKAYDLSVWQACSQDARVQTICPA